MSESNFLQEKLAVLEKISSEISKIEVKLEAFKTKKSQALLHVSVHKWVFNTFEKGSTSYDKHFAKRMRTFVGLCGEELMKILLKLDQVQSEGKEEIKVKRRQLVSKINNVILPLADEYLVEAQAVVTLYNKINRILKSRIPQDEEKVEPKKMEMEETDEEPKKAVESEDEKEDDDDDDSSDDDDEPQRKVPQRFSPNDDEDEEVLLKPKYQIEQADNAVLVKLRLPSNEVADDLRFQLKGYNDELLVIGQNFELPFQVNSNNYILEEAKVRILSEKQVVIIIPKRRYSRIPHTYSQRGDNPFHRQQRPQRYPGYSTSPFFRNSFW